MVEFIRKMVSKIVNKYGKKTDNSRPDPNLSTWKHDPKFLQDVLDVLEALTGEFNSRDPEDVWATQRQDGSWLLDGLIPVPELKDRLDLKGVPEEHKHKGRYNTLSGMMMWLIGSLHRTEDVTEWDGWRLEVVDLDGNRVDKVLASRLPDRQDKPDNPESAPDG